MLAFAPPAPAEATRAPNVLLIVVDDLNTDLGIYGHPQVRTPHIDALARRGLRFTRAYAQYPQCNQSRASMLTGLYPHETGVLDLTTHFRNRLPDVTTLPQHFRRHGYFTARVGKVFHQGVPEDIGQDGLDDAPSWEVALNPSGIDRLVEDRIVTIVPPAQDRRRFGGVLSWLALDSEDREHTDGKVADEAIRLLEQHQPKETGRPFFLAVGFYRPHTPFVAPSRYFDLYPLEHIQPLQVPDRDRASKPVAALSDRPWQAEMSDLQKRQAIQAYHAAISFMDAQAGRLLATLERLDLVRDTLVVFVSDNGYQLGAHGLWQKTDLFEGSTRVPLILAAPGRLDGGGVHEGVVELVDLYPTLVKLAGLPPPPHALPGQDLLAAFSGKSPARIGAASVALSGAHRTRPELRGRSIIGQTLRTADFRYTEWNRGEEGRELYDYRNDPGEIDNLAGATDFRGLIQQLQAELAGRLPPMEAKPAGD